MSRQYDNNANEITEQRRCRANNRFQPSNKALTSENVRRTNKGATEGVLRSQRWGEQKEQEEEKEEVEGQID